VQVVSNTHTTANTVITLRKSVADTSITVTYAATQTGYKADTTNTSSFANTDEVNYKIVTDANVGTTTTTFSLFKIEFEPTTATDCISIGALSGSTSFTSASSTIYFTPFGRLTSSVTEANAQYRARTAFISQDFYTYAGSNARTNDSVFGVRKNGAAGNQSVTYTAGQTGAKEDTANTDSVSVGDDFNYYLTTLTGVESLSMRVVSSSLVNTTNDFITGVASTGGASINFNNTVYTAVGGEWFGDVGTDGALFNIPNFSFRAKEFSCNVATNTIATSDTVFNLVYDSVDTALTVSYAAAQTGLKNDSTHTLLIQSELHYVAYNIITPNTSGAIAPNWTAMVGTAVGVDTFEDLSYGITNNKNGLFLGSTETINGLA
jgi:hypothetical protein